MSQVERRMWSAVLAARQRWIVAVVAGASLSLAAGTLPAVAWQGTPTAGRDIPTAAECTIAPRSADELRDLFHEAETMAAMATPVATPVAAPPVGEPADAQTIAPINATWREWVACVNAGDQQRMFALYSDRMVLRQFVVDIAFGVTEEALFEFLAATPVPSPPEQSAPADPITEAVVLSDGRVAVTGPGDAGRGDVRVFVKQGDRWLLDDWYELSS